MFDKQDKRYAKALTAEIEARTELAKYESWIEALENREICKILSEEPKLAEWKARAQVKERLIGNRSYRYTLARAFETRHTYLRAKARLVVIETGMKNMRAQLNAAWKEMP